MAEPINGSDAGVSHASCGAAGAASLAADQFNVRQRENAPTLMGSDEQDIHAVHSTWIDAVNSGDLDQLLALTTDDVVFINPGQAPFGRDGFSFSFTAAHKRMQIRCTSELEEVVVVGEVAYARSRDALAVVQRANGNVTELAGHRITVYRKQPHGRWLLARDAHTLSPVEEPNQSADPVFSPVTPRAR